MVLCEFDQNHVFFFQTAAFQQNSKQITFSMSMLFTMFSQLYLFTWSSLFERDFHFVIIRSHSTLIFYCALLQMLTEPAGQADTEGRIWFHLRSKRVSSPPSLAGGGCGLDRPALKAPIAPGPVFLSLGSAAASAWKWVRFTTLTGFAACICTAERSVGWI